MLLVGSENAAMGFADGMRILRRGGRALDAVEATIRRVESNPADHSVGYGGLPNIVGDVELDASIMDGRSLEAGAVCAVHGYEHVISLARQVMRRLPHVFLAGAGAERLARELHMPRRHLLTARARATFERKVTPALRRRHRQLDGARSCRHPGSPGGGAGRGLLRYRQRDRHRSARRHRERREHQRMGLEVPGTSGGLPRDRRRQLRGQSLRRLRLHRLRGDGHPLQHGALRGAVPQDGARSRGPPAKP